VHVSAYDPYIDDFHGMTRAGSLDALLTSSDIVTPAHRRLLARVQGGDRREAVREDLERYR
jgi:hypothetical protein